MENIDGELTGILAKAKELQDLERGVGYRAVPMLKLMVSEEWTPDKWHIEVTWYPGPSHERVTRSAYGRTFGVAANGLKDILVVMYERKRFHEDG